MMAREGARGSGRRHREVSGQSVSMNRSAHVPDTVVLPDRIEVTRPIPHSLGCCRARASSGFPSETERSLTRQNKNLALPFRSRQWINFRNPAQAVRFGRMRARDEGSADLGGVPAGLDAEAKRFFCHDVTWR